MLYLDFDGANDYLNAPASADFSGQVKTIFVVSEGGSGTPISIASNGLNQEFLLRVNSAFHHVSSGNYKTKSHHCVSSIPTSEARIIMADFGPAANDVDISINGLYTTASTSGNTNASFSVVNRAVNIGRRNNGEYLNGHIYEVIVYDTNLSALERDSVNEYLRCKYSITNNNCGNLSTTACNMNTTQNTLATKEFRYYPNPIINQLNLEFTDTQECNLQIVNVSRKQEWEERCLCIGRPYDKNLHCH